MMSTCSWGKNSQVHSWPHVNLPEASRRSWAGKLQEAPQCIVQESPQISRTHPPASPRLRSWDGYSFSLTDLYIPFQPGTALQASDSFPTIFWWDGQSSDRQKFWIHRACLRSPSLVRMMAFFPSSFTTTFSFSMISSILWTASDYTRETWWLFYLHKDSLSQWFEPELCAPTRNWKLPDV